MAANAARGADQGLGFLADLKAISGRQGLGGDQGDGGLGFGAIFRLVEAVPINRRAG